jgi:hypothetical protein
MAQFKFNSHANSNSNNLIQIRINKLKRNPINCKLFHANILMMLSSNLSLITRNFRKGKNSHLG